MTTRIASADSYLEHLQPGMLKAVSFDLDDTLHRYRQASGHAMTAVYDYIEEQYGRPVAQLREAYSVILHTAQANHFVENKPAREYRRTRFDALLERFSILGLHDTEACLDIYQETLDRNLTLNPGAREALQAARQQGLRTMVVTEGPDDAQQGVLARLKLAPLVDHLITSSRLGVSKTDGLYAAAAAEAGLPGSAILHVGDSPLRDAQAARKAGWHSLVVGEAPNDLGLPQIRQLDRLAKWLATAPVHRPGSDHGNPSTPAP